MKLIIFFCCMFMAESYKILVFSPVISRSHMISNGRIADELAMAGHDVVLFEPDFLNLSHTVNPVKLARRWQIHGFASYLHDVLQAFSGSAFEEISQYRAQQGWLQYQHAYDRLCEDLINRETLMEELRLEKFDGFFGEQISLCGHGIAYSLGIKSHFWVSSCAINDRMAWILGLPQPLSYIPSYSGTNSNKMSYFERVQNIYDTFLHIYFGNKAAEETNKVFRKKYGEDFPNLKEIASNSDLVFVSTDEFIEIQSPTLPHVVHIGGIGFSGNAVTYALEEPFAEQMQKGNQGIVYFSLGTLVNTTLLPAKAMTTIMNAIEQTPDHYFILVVDKFDKFTRKLAETVPNVYITSWAPQPAILKHPRLRAFITHGGYNSLIEASRAAVPLLIIPFFFDQTRNGHAVEASGWGIAVDKRALIEKPEKVFTALRELLKNENYKNAAVRISTLIRTKPFNASERLVKYTEFVLANGGMKELLVEGRRLNVIVYYNLDIIVPLVVGFLLLFYITLRSLAAVIAKSAKAEKVKLQ